MVNEEKELRDLITRTNVINSKVSKPKSNPFCWDCKIQHCVIKLHEKESKLQRALIKKLEDKIKTLETGKEIKF